MLGLGWYEILLIAVVAVVIVGPKDLPVVLRTVFNLTRKAQALTREFRKGIEDLAKESGLDAVKKDLQSVTKGDLAGSLGDDFFDDKELKKTLSVADPAPDPAAGKSIGGAGSHTGGHTGGQGGGKEDSPSGGGAQKTEKVPAAAQDQEDGSPVPDRNQTA
ncbi:MAG: Sec-independent protein translocase protein TatB [Alphaproteobacteria bacterium]|nr:Sec-independent protein translocase protein TatB [Alphaproteobacteria bacterium]